jgi:hypothetical protein
VAQQDLVRALVPEDQAEALREEVLALDGAGVTTVTFAAADPASYRDERPDLLLRRLVQRGGMRLLLGAIGGALVGAAIALLVPVLREFAPWTVLLLAFGGAWGGAVTATARGVQVDKPEDDVPDEHVELGPDDAADVRVMTVVVERDRDEVVDLLMERDVVLLDSWHPKEGQRPAERRARTTTESEGGGPRRPPRVDDHVEHPVEDRIEDGR